MATLEASRPGRVLGISDETSPAVHLLVFSPEAKLATSAADFEAALRPYLPSGNLKSERAGAVALCQELTQRRQQLLKVLESPSVSDVGTVLDAALRDYLAALQGLVNAPARKQPTLDAAAEGLQSGGVAGLENSTAGDAAAGATAPAREAGAGQSAAASASSGATPASPGAEEGCISGDSPLRHGALRFAWREIMLSRGREAAAHDTLFEFASAVIAAALWRMRRAAWLARGARAGTSLEDATQAYHALCGAAGMFTFVEEQCAGRLRDSVNSTDCQRQAAAGYCALCLADAQAITVRRAVAKGNAPGLVAALAADTAALLRSAAAAADSVPGAGPGAKARLYVDYQAAVHSSLAAAYAGQAQLAGGAAGAALRWLAEAKTRAAAAEAAGRAYDRALPVTGRAERERYAEDLQLQLERLTGRAEQDNRTVYFQHVPPEAPPPPPPQRLVAPQPYAPPPPAPAAAAAAALMPVPQAKIQATTPPPPSSSAAKPPGAPSGATAGAAVALGTEAGGPAARGGAWWQWLLVFVAMPLLALVSLVGAVVWLLLLPIKCFCCPLGCVAQLLWSAVEWLLKAPLRALLWASGKPWRPQRPPELAAGSAAAAGGAGRKGGPERVPPV